MSSHLENNPSFEWNCPLTRTGKRSAHSTCAKEFAKEYGFQLIETSDDGNCFFYTLTKFAKRAGFEPLLLESNEHRNAMALRQIIVDYIEEHFDEYSHFLVNNNSESVNQQIQQLRQNGVWESDAGDLVPVVAANAFRIHINLYDIVVGNNSDHIRLVPIRSDFPTNLFVSIMRVREGHFQLLWPRSGNYQSHTSSQPSYMSQNMNSKQDVIHAAHLAVEAATVAVQAAKKVSVLSPSQPSSSITKNEQKLNQMIQKLNQLSLNGPRRSTRSTRSTRSMYSLQNNKNSSVKSSLKTRRKKKQNSSSYVNNNNNNELRRVIEASVYNQ